MAQDPLFVPLNIGGRRSRNRIAALPLFTGYARPDGGVTPLLLEHYWRLASSGAGLVIVANVAVAKDGRTSLRTLRIDDDRFIAELGRLAATIKHRGSLACVQLNHAGRFARTDRPLLPAPFDAAHLNHDVAALKSFMQAFPFADRFALTARFMQMTARWGVGMTPAERERVIGDFARAARRAVAAGFDMLELHGATGYLLAQFLSAATNRAPGPWSGSFDRRSAFVQDVVRAVRESVPENFPVGYRLLLREWVPDGIDLEEAKALAQVLEELGVAYFSVSAGTYPSMFSPGGLRKTRRIAYLKEDVRCLRRAVATPLILGGRVIRPPVARRILAEGIADMVGLGRPLLTDPGWPEKACSGGPVHVCIDCRFCLKRVIQEKPLACARWPELEIDRVDLECALQVRLNACLLFTSQAALDIGPAALQDGLPQPEALQVRLVYVLGEDPDTSVSQAAAQSHWQQYRRYWQDTGRPAGLLEARFKTARAGLNDVLLTDARRDGFGMLVLVDGREVRLKEILASKWRQGIFLAPALHRPAARVFTAVDLSPATLVLLRFMSCAFPGLPKGRFRCVHVSDGVARAARRRWEKMLPIAGWDTDLPLEVLPEGPGGVAETLVAAAAGWDVMVLGRRGMSRIKTLLLGSVSRRVLRASPGASVLIVS